jgi:hypothetical protein
MVNLMLEFKCLFCGCPEFKVSTLGQHFVCVFCKEKFEWSGTNWIHLPKPTLMQSFVESINHLVPEPLKIETQSEALKRMGIEKVKKEIENDKRKQVLLHRLKARRERLRLNWDSELEVLGEKKMICFGKNEHKGKLRGKHIALAFSKKLKELMLKHRVKFKDSESVVELIEGV